MWKEGATNTLESGGRKINENKLLSATGPRRPVEPTIRSIGDAPPGPSRKTAAEKFNPYARRCKICKGSIAQQGAYYCQTCAYQKGNILIQYVDFGFIY